MKKIELKQDWSGNFILFTMILWVTNIDRMFSDLLEPSNIRIIKFSIIILSGLILYFLEKIPIKRVRNNQILFVVTLIIFFGSISFVFLRYKGL